jgi:hypothetical protein
MATVVSRRFLPPRRERFFTQEARARSEGSFFLGLTFAIPLGIFLWLSLGLAVRTLV